MKILLVNKFHYLKGGSEKYYFDLAELLEENGHEVAFFSMKDEKNIKTHNKEYFVEPIDLNANNKLKAKDIIYSKKNQKKMKEALEDFKPDIVHLNNFQRQLSASILKPIKKRKIPIVYTAHDIQAICPNKTMLDSENNICEECLNGRYKNCFKKTCIKNSKLKSLLGAIENKYYRIKKIYQKQIDYIITPSEFYRKKLIEDGIKPKKIETIHNFVKINEYNIRKENGDYALYFGRISKEKGIYDLIEAAQKINNLNLYLAGDGPDFNDIKRIIQNNKMSDRIKMLGFLNSNQIKETIGKCKFVVLPSIWRDNCPYSIIETMAIGKAIIGTNIGGIPELIQDGKTGFLTKFKDNNDLVQKMKKLYSEEKLSLKMGEEAKKVAGTLYTEENYYNRIIKIYERLVIKNEK